MRRHGSIFTTRGLLIASIVFGLFVLFDIALFAWLIFDSLSQREIEKVILQTREEVEPLARELESRAEDLDQDLYVVVTVTKETRSYIDRVLEDRDVVRSIEIRDADDVVVFSDEVRMEGEEDAPLADGEVPTIELGEPGSRETPGVEVPVEQLEVPIGDLGTLVVGLSPEAMQERIGTLRRDLIRQASVIGALTMLLLGVAYAAIWLLVRHGRRLEEQALEAERMAYVGTLASGLAHEIRNPLNALNLNMQMLDEEARERGGGDGSEGRLINITRSEISRLERLVTDFLSYAKPRPLELETLPAVALFERVEGVLDGELRARGVDLRIRDETGGAAVRVDKSQMGQLLLNLAQNALAAVTASGRPPRIRLVVRREAATVMLEVVDNGVGMDAEARQKIFDIFYSTKKGGTGLGLAIVQRIAKAHDAEVEVESEPGVGTTLRVRLPAVVET